jgi:hypothetical protein
MGRVIHDDLELRRSVLTRLPTACAFPKLKKKRRWESASTLRLPILPWALVQLPPVIRYLSKPAAKVKQLHNSLASIVGVLRNNVRNF